MAFVMNVPVGEAPKRGDLIQTNCGDRRERTWFILHVHRINVTVREVEDYRRWRDKPRYKVWRARWWELEAEFRMKLYRSAERRGGQVIWRPEATKAFEDLRRKSR
jgi:hypothetical protein